MSFEIPLIKPQITDDDINRVVEVLRSGYLTEGRVTRAFEDAVAAFVGTRHAVAFSSWTTGAETVLRALEIGPGDEVIVPDYTHPATADVVALVGATPVLVDCDPRTANIDFAALEAACTPRTKAILPVSLFGNPLDYTRLSTLKERYGFFIIEDAACSLGAAWQGEKLGALADASIFSLHPRKFITTGEGGIVTTNDDRLASFLRSYKNFGMDSSNARRSSRFVRIGTNYKMSDILAALGLSQMQRIDELLARRRELAAQYQALLRELPAVQLLETPDGAVPSWQSFVILVPARDQIMMELRDKGIEAQIGTFSLHAHPAFATAQFSAQDLTGSHRLFTEALALPLYHTMTQQQLGRVVHELAASLRKHAPTEGA